MINIVRKICFCFYTATDDSNFWKKMPVLLKNVSPLKKLPISDGESFLASILDLN